MQLADLHQNWSLARSTATSAWRERNVAEPKSALLW